MSPPLRGSLRLTVGSTRRVAALEGEIASLLVSVSRLVPLSGEPGAALGDSGELLAQQRSSAGQRTLTFLELPVGKARVRARALDGADRPLSDEQEFRNFVDVEVVAGQSLEATVPLHLNAPGTAAVIPVLSPRLSSPIPPTLEEVP